MTRPAASPPDSRVPRRFALPVAVRRPLRSPYRVAVLVGAGACLLPCARAQDPSSPTSSPKVLRDFEPFPSRWFAPGRAVGGVEPP
jgi:hypothetical protein